MKWFKYGLDEMFKLKNELLRVDSMNGAMRFFETNSKKYFLYHIKNPLYNTYRVRKKSGGYRELDQPGKVLKRYQKKLNEHLQAVYFSVKPDASQGFIRTPDECPYSFNIQRNASFHTGKKHILNVDLENFFHAITSVRTKDVFMDEPFYFSEKVATLMAMITTYNNRLPMGSPTSPILSNFATLNLDKKLEKLTEKYGISYTRYADDITLSADDFITSEFFEKVKAVIEEEDFSINNKKTRYQSMYGRQEVTGLVVNEKVNVNRSYIRNIRAALYQFSKYGLEEATKRHYNIPGKVSSYEQVKFAQSLRGRILFVYQVRGKQDPLTYQLASRFNELIKCYKVNKENEVPF